MKKLTQLFIAAMLFNPAAYSQQVARATNVNLVTTPGTKLVVQGGMTFLGTSDWKDSGQTYLYKNNAANPEGWLDSTASGVMNTASTGNVFFNGAFLQSFYGKTRFYDLAIRNPKGDTLLSSCEVRNLLHLDTGYIFTSSGFGNDSLLVSNTAPAAIVSTSNFAKSWVHGRLSRTENLSGAPNEYLFPIGKIKLPDSLYAPIKIDKSNTTLNTYTAEYFPTIPFDRTNIQNPPIDHISAVENWEITAASSGGADADAKVSLSWRTYSQVSNISNVRDSLIVVQYVVNPGPGFSWNKLGSTFLHIVNGADSSFGYVKHPDYLNAFSNSERRFTLGTLSKYNALPIKLIYFTAIGDGNKVRLNWEVTNEQDIRVYEVEHSTDALSFSHLISVNSLRLMQSTYTGYDYTPVTGWNYYRLKIFDLSGSYTYSPVRAVHFNKGLEQVSIFPNPATDLLNILLPSSYSDKVTLQVYGIDGKYLSGMKPTANTVQLHVSSLPAGTYILRIIKNEGNIESYRFVKQ